MEKYISKIIFVDDDLVGELKSMEIAKYNDFMRVPLDTKIISLSDDESVRELLSLDCVDAGQIKSGNVVVKSPCRASYFIPLIDLSEDIAVRKYDIFHAFCIALGAKGVSISHVESDVFEEHSVHRTNTKMHAKSAVLKIYANFWKSEKNRSSSVLDKKVGVVSKAQGGNPDLVAARAIIDKYGLQHDSLFDSLYEARCLVNNRLLSKEFLIDTSKDLEKLIDESLKAKLDVVSKLYEVGGSLSSSSDNAVKSLVAFKLHVKVDF